MRTVSRLVLITAVLAACLLGVWLYQPDPSPVLAQGSGQNTFTASFSVPINASTSTFLKVPNKNQIGHTISYVFGTVGSGLASCGIMFEGSADGTHWQTVGASTNLYENGLRILAATTGTFTANGFFPAYRLKFNPARCPQSTLFIPGMESRCPMGTFRKRGMHPRSAARFSSRI